MDISACKVPIIVLIVMAAILFVVAFDLLDGHDFFGVLLLICAMYNLNIFLNPQCLVYMVTTKFRKNASGLVEVGNRTNVWLCG